MMKQSVALLLFFLLVGAFAAPSKRPSIKGLSRSDMSTLRYDEKSFTCRDGSKTIPFSQVNDNFCDCEDGTDEPGTSACPNGQFYCVNKGHSGKHIHSSQVQDNICDCCDGSDEVGTKDCPNTCQAEAYEAQRSVREELENHLEGLVVKKEYIARAVTELAEKKTKLAQLEAEIEELRTQKEAEKEKRNKLQDEEDAARKALADKKAQEEATTAALEQVEAEQKEEERENGETEEMEETTEGSEGETEEQEDEPEADLVGVHVADEVVDESLKPFIEATKQQKEVVSELERKISSMQLEIEKIRTLLETNFGEDNVFYALHDKCFSADTVEYTYELCLFDKISQIPKRGGSSTSLGKWDAEKSGEDWTVRHKFMDYTGGQRCWGGPDRSTRVEVFCAKENRVTDPQEPNKCEYTLKFYTPAVCSEAHAQILQLNLQGGHDEEEEQEAGDSHPYY